MVVQAVKDLSTMQETQILSLGQEDPLEKENGKALQYSCLENSNPWGCKSVRHDWATKHQF